jgi:hypothetical protein
MGGKIAYFMKELEICAIDPEMGITTLEHMLPSTSKGN